MTLLEPQSDQPLAAGWQRVEGRTGLCVDPFGDGLHFCKGTAIQNVRAATPESRQMCTSCYGRLMAGEGPQGD